MKTKTIEYCEKGEKVIAISRGDIKLDSFNKFVDVYIVVEATIENYNISKYGVEYSIKNGELLSFDKFLQKINVRKTDEVGSSLIFDDIEKAKEKCRELNIEELESFNETAKDIKKDVEDFLEYYNSLIEREE